MKMEMNAQEKEFFETFKKFNKGVRSVKVSDGFVSVFCSARAALGVKIDMLRSGAFRSVAVTTSDAGTIVHGCVAS